MTKNLAIIIGGVLILVFGLPLLLMYFWSWTVPDIFAGMVENHLLPASITYQQAIKLIGFMALLNVGVGVSGIFRSSK